MDSKTESRNMPEAPETSTPRVQTTVRLPPDLLADVDRLAKQRDISRTELIVRALRQATHKPAQPVAINFDGLFE